MAFSNIQAVIFAAGRSSRFKTGKTKLAEKICGQEMVAYPARLFAELHIPTSIVVGFQRDIIERIIKKHVHNDLVSFIHQKEQLGTGHALRCTQQTWSKDHILIMNGDMPMVTPEIIERLYERHCAKNATVSFVTAHNTDPRGSSYGRVIKSNETTHSETTRIIEAKDLKEDYSEYCCINAGIYLVQREFLEQHIKNIVQSDVSKEWYITDLIRIASKEKKIIETISAPFDRIRGINTFKELWAAEQVKKSEIINYWMEKGVRFSIAHNVHIDLDVTIGAGTFIDSGVQLFSGTTIGKHCTIGAYSILRSTTIYDHAHLLPHTIIHNSTIGSYASVGPFAFIREKSIIQDHARVGNFVEIKKSTIGKKTKAKHLTYLGDTTTGENVLIGAGTITCNYDGVTKHKTIIKDETFIGSNNTLVAPVSVGKGAFTAAGSTITEDVPDGALAIARERQTNKNEYAQNIKDRKDPKKKNVAFIGAVKTINDSSINSQ